MRPINSFLQKSLEAAYDVPKFSTFAAFLQHGFSLNKEDRFARFDFKYSPWVRTIASWIDSATVEWVYLIQGSQTCKTTVQMAFLLYVSQKEPCRLLWVQSTEEEAKQFITERLRPYIDGYDSEAITKRSWRIESFRVFKARVKVGYASNEQTLKTVPAAYVVGDECAMWKHAISLVKKRTRTFTGKRKGLFATTPPKNGTHHSWQEAKEADFYQWWVPCPKCSEYQPLTMSGLKWGGKDGEGWNYEVVKATAYYECRACKAKMYERDKLDIINRGKAVCVSPDNNFKPVADKNNTAKTLQVSALYSVFTTWGEEACLFLQAKHAGVDALKIFITDELAEVPNNVEASENLKDYELAKFIDGSRQSGFLTGYDLYTAGTDVQRNGELYVVLVGWKKGVIPTGHVLVADVVQWCGGNFAEKWARLLSFAAPVGQMLARMAIDATDGLVSQDIFDFCNYAGRQFVALKDSTNLHVKTSLKRIDQEVGGKKTGRQQLVLVANSDKIKDDLASAFARPAGEVGSWSFPSDIAPEFLKALTMEHRVTEKSGKSSWKPVYVHAPNHYFSALVYACAAMEEYRIFLQPGQAVQAHQQRPRMVSRGIYG